MTSPGFDLDLASLSRALGLPVTSVQVGAEAAPLATRLAEGLDDFEPGAVSAGPAPDFRPYDLAPTSAYVPEPRLAYDPPTYDVYRYSENPWETDIPPIAMPGSAAEGLGSPAPVARVVMPREESP